MKLFRRICRTVFLLILLAGLTLFYAFKIEPHLLVVKEYHIDKDRNEKETLTVVQFSDTEISQDYTEKELEQAVKKINEKNPDLVVFTGDLFNNYALYHPKDRIIEILGSIEAAYGKYAVWGNKDYGGGASRQYANIMEQAGFTLLKNEAATLTLPNGNRIFLGGIDDGLLGNPDMGWLTSAAKQDFDYRILLFHEPDMADELSSYAADLILSGHSHGGQVKVPFVKESEIFPQYKYMNGFYTLGEDTQLYVNSGMGTSRLQVRFMVPPQIAVFYIALP